MLPAGGPDGASGILLPPPTIAGVAGIFHPWRVTGGGRSVASHASRIAAGGLLFEVDVVLDAAPVAAPFQPGFRRQLAIEEVTAAGPRIFHVPLQQEVPLESLRSAGRIACLDMQGRDPRDPGFAGFDCYLFGNEARGVPREALDMPGTSTFAIRGSGSIESLNLAAVVNICAWEISRAR